MYFKVLAVRKDLDIKEILVKATSYEEAGKQCESVKKFLFPKQSDKKVFCCVDSGPIIPDSEFPVSYYKIRAQCMKQTKAAEPVEEDEYQDYYRDAVIKAEYAEEARDIAKQTFGEGLMYEDDNPDNWDIYVTPFTVEQCIELEKKELDKEIFSRYFSRRYDGSKMTVREYSTIRKREEANRDSYYTALCEFAKYLRLERLLNRQCNVGKVPYGIYKSCLEEMFQAQTEEAFNRALNELKKHNKD